MTRELRVDMTYLDWRRDRVSETTALRSGVETKAYIAETDLFSIIVSWRIGSDEYACTACLLDGSPQPVEGAKALFHDVERLFFTERLTGNETLH